ncbi:MAG: TPM domain-containing protein [Candidatus Omnitrophica bacterium]|nr:TPM domain-containing protein [Candidatus Omnitrophota bacterium]
MKRVVRVLLIAAGLSGMVCGVLFAQQANFPARAQGYVTDTARVLSNKDVRAIEALAYQLEQKTSAQLAVVTVSSTSPQTIEQYANQLFERWGIGQKGKDNGVLLLMAMQDRKVRIETGYGIEGIITDLLAHRIIETIMVPRFKSSQYSVGLHEGAVAIVSLIAKDAGITITGKEDAVYDRVNSASSLTAVDKVIVLFFFMIFLSGLLGPVMFPGRYRRHGRRRGGYWYGGGYGGGGGFGGGFGGFGGGMSGGGGASGGW